jgi:hypothetical protein
VAETDELMHAAADLIDELRAKVHAAETALSAERERADRAEKERDAFMATYTAVNDVLLSGSPRAHDPTADRVQATLDRLMKRAEAADAGALAAARERDEARERAEAAERNEASLRERVGALEGAVKETADILDSFAAMEDEEGRRFAANWTRRISAKARAALSAPSSSPAATAPYYLSDGSTVMLPVEEVERRRKAAAKVIGAALRWRYAMCGSKTERRARGLKDRASELLAALREFPDAASPAATGSDAGWGPLGVCDLRSGSAPHARTTFCTNWRPASPSPGESDATTNSTDEEG